MQVLRTVVESIGALLISTSAFAFMGLLLFWHAMTGDTGALVVESKDVGSAVYAADVEMALALLAATQTPSPAPMETVTEPTAAPPEPPPPPPAPTPNPVVSSPQPAPQHSPAPTVSDGPPGVPAETLAAVPATDDTDLQNLPTLERIRSVREQRRQQAQQRRYSDSRQEEATESQTTQRATQRTRTHSTSRQRDCDAQSEDIAMVSPNHYEVQRDLVDYYTSHLKEASKLAYAYWYKEDGDVVGFRIRRVRCGTILHQAGFRNGDVIRGINGRDVTTIAQAMVAYHKLRRKRNLRVKVQRNNGEVMVLHFKLT